MRSLLIVLSLLACVAIATAAAAAQPAAAAALSEEENQFLFVQWAKSHARVYTHDEFFTRYNTFKSNLQFIRESNAAQRSYKLAMNHLGDLTQPEYRRLLGFRGNVTAPTLTPSAAVRVPRSSLPAAVDWRQKNVVTPVPDQLQCGASPFFGAVGAIESIHAIRTGSLVSLSVQQIVDCTYTYGDQGCCGGMMDYVYTYAVNNSGICTAQDYPYKGVDQPQCQSCQPAVGITGYADVPANDNDALLAAVAQQPVSNAIDASHSTFQFYSSGVLNDNQCTDNPNHGMLIVGYDHDATSNLDYWIVKNWWTAQWGQQGYVYIKRDSGKGPGMCGVAMYGGYPTA